MSEQGWRDFLVAGGVDEEAVRKTMNGIALAVVLGITGLGLTLSASAADESVEARSAWTA